MRKAVFIFLAAISLQQVAAQQAIKGTIADTLEKKHLSNAVISLLNKKDSTLARFTRSDKSGHFTLPNISSGSYVILITFPKFADFADTLHVNEGSDLDLGSIALTLKSHLLQEVIIRSAGAIRIKGDTTEFVADSFVVKEGATVEDLLKKLPGFQVNSKGEITAQGKRVDKFLVDGEEFFGDDPTMATQNITSKAVDKVQVYDTKTEQQQLKGISTGGEGKTVNIKLKEDQKRGAFGKVNAGYGYKDYVDAKGLYNRFVGKKKVSLYGTKTNISTGSLNWEDRQKLGIEDDYEYDEISGFYYSFGGNDEFNNWSLKGLPDAYTAGALFIDKWKEDKQSVNSSYRFNRLGTRNESSTLTQLILPTGITYTNNFAKTNGLNQQHALNGKYEWKIDSLTSIKFTTAGIYKTTDGFSDTYSEYLNSNHEFINRSYRINDNSKRRIQSDNVLTYRQAFKKKNRLLLATLRYGITDDEQEGIVNTTIHYHRNGIYAYSDTIDQQKMFDGLSKTLGAKITYSEPLSKDWSLVTEYSYNKNASTSHRNTFERNYFGKYEELNPFFSNNFNLDAYLQSGSAILRYTTTKVKAAFGSGLSSVKMDLFSLDSNRHSRYTFLRFVPQAQIGYTIKPQTNISFNYRGTTRQPSIDQLQPIRNNEDPLNIFIGNPDLKVGFTHNFGLFFNQYKVLSQRGIWLNMNYNISNNAISNFNTIDSLGRRIYLPVNVNGNQNWSYWSNYNKGKGSKKFYYGFNSNGNGGRNIAFVNGRKSITDYTTLNIGINFGYDNQEKRSFYINPRIGYNKSKNSLQPNVNNNYFTYGGYFNGFIKLPANLEFNTDGEVTLRQRIAAFDRNTNLVLINTNLSKKIFKDKSGKLMFMVSDLLNQNRGYNRIINSNFVTDERFLRVSRYFMLKLEWTFNKMP
ncbi:MAG: TonB-dependent receptor family protein, partial [Bacteroidota bacterium]|nr:TonB-dependent receptor family protein [Bacteroidota bacterium]